MAKRKGEQANRVEAASADDEGVAGKLAISVGSGESVDGGASVSQNVCREGASEESGADSTEDVDTGGSILNEVQQFLERRRELAQKLREEIEATQRRLEELQETLELLQGEMGLIEEKEKKAKKAKPKPPKAAAKDASEPRTKPLFGDLTAGEDELSSQEGASTSREASDEASGDEAPVSLPNELAVD